MRLKISRSKNSASLYVTKTVYIDKKERTITVADDSCEWKVSFGYLPFSIFLPPTKIIH